MSSGAVYSADGKRLLLADRDDPQTRPTERDANVKRREKNPGPFIFAGSTSRPLVLANLARRDIAPKLKEKGIPLEGWHGFRRGLASTLYDLGVHDKVIQQILRHASVEVTRKHYIKTNTTQAESAMRKLDKAFSRTQKTKRKSYSKTVPVKPSSGQSRRFSTTEK